MGIYLPNMEMPEDGVYFCEVGVIDGVGTITFHTEERQVFHLVEVPPHGDLIDAFAFRREMDTNYPFDKFTQSKYGEANAAKSTILMMLGKAPIIIKAEE